MVGSCIALSSVVAISKSNEKDTSGSSSGSDVSDEEEADRIIVN